MTVLRFVRPAMEDVAAAPIDQPAPIPAWAYEMYRAILILFGAVGALKLITDLMQ